MTEKVTRTRFIASGLIMGLAMAALGCHLAGLHLGDHGKARDRIEDRITSLSTLDGTRGNIYDREGGLNLLAATLGVKDVCVDPVAVQASNAFARVVSAVSGGCEMPADELAVRLREPGRRYLCVQRFVKEEAADGIRRQNLPGIFFNDAIVRHYPLSAFMCHVLGFVNHDGQGSAGVEQQYDAYLRGCPGQVEGRRDARRRALYWREGRNIPPIRGASVVLTVDQNIQFVIERSLDQLIEHNSAPAAWAIVQDVRSGEILAMASRPAYDPNEFRKATDTVRLNRAIGSVYEPGSTFKAVVFAAAINEGVAAPDSVYDCENGAWSYAGRTLRDYHPYGRLTVADGIKKSSNIMSAKLAVELGQKRFYQYMKAFGIGEPLGIDLPGEEAGILHNPRRWSNLSLSRIPIGQGVSVTALQMLGVYCAIANGGFLMRPYVVREIRTDDGTILLRQEPRAIRRCIPGDTAATMRQLLRRVTEQGGTGALAAIDGYAIAAKTGTAQKPVAGGYSDTDYIASFVGFFPAEAPRVGVIVVVDTPQPAHTGGRVVGPVFAAIAEQIVRCMDIPPGREAALVRR